MHKRYGGPTQRPRPIEEMFQRLGGYRNMVVEWEGVVAMAIKGDTGFYGGVPNEELSGHFVRIPVTNGAVCLLIEGDIAPFRAVAGKQDRVAASVKIGWLDLGFGDTITFIQAEHEPMACDERPELKLSVHHNDQIGKDTPLYCVAVRGEQTLGYIVVRDNN